MEPENSIKLDVSTWKIRSDERSKGRMKLSIKLSKDEATSFKNFEAVVKPEGTSSEEFIRVVFVTGIEAMNQQLAGLMQKYASENKEELAASGITVIEDEDGNVKLADTNLIESELSGAPIIEESVITSEDISKHEA
jgi:hypothetical protein|tara:strand:+ start:79 stop:489 length:411 start_codon:yes stop_codon:yes gene_type:complete